MKEMDWAWLAGFVDADGHIRDDGHPMVAVTQKHTDILYEIQEFVGAGEVNRLRTDHECYEWRVQRWPEVEPVIRGLLPYLRVKREAALTQLDRDHGPSNWTDAEDTFLRENYCQMEDSELAAELPGRTARSVEGRRRRLGLSKK